MYTQLCVAVLCAMNAGTSTKTIAAIARRVGKTTAKFHKDKVVGACSRLEEHYCCAISPVVWPEGGDPILKTFYPYRVTAAGAGGGGGGGGDPGGGEGGGGGGRRQSWFDKMSKQIFG